MFKKPTPISKICNDSLKYVLLNAVNVAAKGVVLPSVYCKSRINLYKNMFTISKSAKSATIKPNHLYVIPYSKYYTLRHIMYNRGCEVPEYEDDVEIKEQFKRIMAEPHSSKQSLENAFLKIIEGLKTPEVYKMYRDLDLHIMKGPLSAEEIIEFVEATSETDIFVANKLSKDVALFTSEVDQIIKMLKDYRFINGWVTATGVAIISAVSGYTKFML